MSGERVAVALLVFFHSPPMPRPVMVRSLRLSFRRWRVERFA